MLAQKSDQLAYGLVLQGVQLQSYAELGDELTERRVLVQVLVEAPASRTNGDLHYPVALVCKEVIGLLDLVQFE